MMKMYREPLDYSVWRFNGKAKDELIAYFASADRAKAYVDSVGEQLAVFKVDTQELIYPDMEY
jgi:hypothetical protein